MAESAATLKWYGDEKKTDMQDEMYKALIVIGDLVKTDAKLNAPVDTGNLRSSILNKTFKSQLETFIYTNLEYAPHVEYGTRYQAGDPFLRPALFGNKDNIEDIFIKYGGYAVD